MKDNHSILPKKHNHKFDRRALQVRDAQRLAVSYAGLGQEELIRLQDSDGRVLASDVIAPHPFPAFARSGMDGYAVRSADLAACDLGNRCG